MVKFSLLFKANLDNVTDLVPDFNDSFNWCFKFACSSCNEETEKWQFFNHFRQIEIQRATANFVLKCKFCLNQNHLQILTNSYRKYSIDDSNKFKSIAQFDMRGLKPTQFSPNTPWEATSFYDSSVKFKEIDLTLKEWFDYDEKSTLPVSINEIETKFEKI